MQYNLIGNWLEIEQNLYDGHVAQKTRHEEDKQPIAMKKYQEEEKHMGAKRAAQYKTINAQQSSSVCAIAK